MPDRKDYPYLSHFMDMQTALWDCVCDPGYELARTNEIYAVFGKAVRNEWGSREADGLFRDITRLRESCNDLCEIQAFFIRQYGIRIKQREIPVIFDRVLEGLSE